MARVSLLCLLLAFAVASSASEHADILTLSPDQGILQLGSHVEYLEDQPGTLSVENLTGQQFRWETSDQEALNFGYTAFTYWVRFSLTLDQEENDLALPYVLEVAYPVLDRVDAYTFQDGVLVAHYAMGDELPYAQRPIDYPNFAIPLEIHPGDITEVYLRVQSSSSVQIPLTLYSNHRLVEKSYEDAIAQALFYGAILVMAIYNLLLFFSIRDVNYLYFVMMVVSTSTLLAGIEGLTFKYLWPQVAWLNDPILVVSLAGIVSFSALFFRNFLDLPRSHPMAGYLALAFAIVPALVAYAAFFYPYRTMMQIITLVAMGAILLGVLAGVIRWLDGFQGAKFFNLAWSCLLVAGFLLALTSLGFLPRNWFTEHVLQIGAGLQAVLLSFAMAHRMSYSIRPRPGQTGH